MINVDNPTNYLLKNLEKIHGFDLAWSTMITNKPAIFNDIDYVKISKFIENEITQKEINLFKSGKLNNLYPNLEYLLVCNLNKYDRILNFSTMIFYNYCRISETGDENILTKNLDKVINEISLTPTKLGCCALTSTNSTLEELEYAWDLKLKKPTNNQSPLEYNFKKLYDKSINFKIFIQYCALRCNTNGFRETWLKDITSNRKLSQVCQKFTNKTNAIDNSQLDEIYDYHTYITANHLKLINSLRNSMNQMFLVDSEMSKQEQKFAVYCYNEEFYLHSVKFSMKVKSDNGKIIKEYLANNHECFIAEKYLISSMQEQIDWVKHEQPIKLNHQKNILTNLLYELLKNDYKNIICYKNMYTVNTGQIISKIKFSGIFGNLYIIEELYLEGRIIKCTRICKSKFNSAKYVIDKGYTIFGDKYDVDKLLDEIDNHEQSMLTREMLNKHYSKYCKPIINHMQEIIDLYKNENNNLIDAICGTHINRSKINNINIKTTNIQKENFKPFQKLTKNLKSSSGYWKAIQNDS